MANPLEYCGYELETKPLIVGWQITIRKDGQFVRNSSVTTNEGEAMMEAELFVDDVIERANH